MSQPNAVQKLLLILRSPTRREHQELKKRVETLEQSFNAVIVPDAIPVTSVRVQIETMREHVKQYQSQLDTVAKTIRTYQSVNDDKFEALNDHIKTLRRKINAKR